jgi:hypothetical protein
VSWLRRAGGAAATVAISTQFIIGIGAVALGHTFLKRAADGAFAKCVRRDFHTSDGTDGGTDASRTPWAAVSDAVVSASCQGAEAEAQ